MSTDPTDWHQVLARVTGALVRGEQRVTTHELLTMHLGVAVTDRACRRLKRVMRELGWRGPQKMRWGETTMQGYWRDPTLHLPAITGRTVEGDVLERVPPGELACQLEAVTQLGLQKIGQILRPPTDRTDGNLLRAQTAAAATAVNAQLRADETKMKQAQRDDVLERLLKVMAEEKKKMEAEKNEEGAISLRDPRSSGDESKA